MTKLAIQQQVLLFTELLSVGSVIPAQIFSFFYEWKIVQLRGFFLSTASRQIEFDSHRVNTKI